MTGKFEPYMSSTMLEASADLWVRERKSWMAIDRALGETRSKQPLRCPGCGAWGRQQCDCAYCGCPN